MYEVLFAVDRGPYVSSRADERVGCTFCAIRDRDPRVFTRRIHVDEKAIILMNIYPYSPGHLQVIPPRHVERLEDLSQSELADSMEYLLRSIYLSQETFRPDGYNIGINLGEAGASIAHIHVQMVPRYETPPPSRQEEVHALYLKNLDMFKGGRGEIELEDGVVPEIREIAHETIGGEKVVIGLSARPYNRGHLVFVMPRPFHKERPEMLAKLFALVSKYKAVIEKSYGPDGFNIGVNLGDVPLSSSRALHLVPRFRRESGFMEVVAGTRIVVESLEGMEEKILGTLEGE
jgi:ATP adenylyltransferase